MTLDEFLENVAKEWRNAPKTRFGQLLFNKLVDTKPNLAESIRETSLDPYYEPSLRPDLYEFLLANWEV